MKHFAVCLRLEDMEILASTIRSVTHFLALEACLEFISSVTVKPFLNTQNTKEHDYKQTQLKILFWY